jgi:hypothetical protein
MTAPLVPQDGPGRRRPTPSLRQIFDGDHVVLLLLGGLGAVGALGKALAWARGEPRAWLWVPFFAVVAAACAALFRRHTSHLCRVFTEGVEIRGRITQLNYVPENRRKVFGLKVTGMPTLIEVVYPAGGGERTIQYTPTGLDDGDVARLGLSVGAEVVLIAHPELREPILRDLSFRKTDA